VEEIIELTKVNEDFKKIRVGIKESINFTETSKVNFYLSVKNTNTGEKFEKKQIGTTSVNIVPNDDIKE
jgi:hypothetical protein